MLIRYLSHGILLALGLACNPGTLDTKVPVGAVSLHIACRGKGTPAVILESGLANDARTWSSVQPDIADFTTVCAYDRAGLGSSSPAPRPHTNQQMVDELHDLLAGADIPAPYVLVGHSMGGVNARLFAAKHPDAVVGMVLVDAMSESQPSRFWSLLPEPLMASFRDNIAKTPEGIDFATLSSSLESLRRLSPSLDDLPLAVLAHGIDDPPPPGANPDVARHLNTTWRSMQEDLARLSSNSAYAVVADARHHIHVDQPKAVITAVSEVVKAARQQRAVDATVISAAAQ